MIKKISLFVFVALLFSCGNRETSDDNDAVMRQYIYDTEKYVYMDRTNCIHAERRCYNMNEYKTIVIANGSDDEELNGENISCGEGTHRIIKDSLKTSDLQWCCQKCISDDMYLELDSIARLHDN